MVQTPKNSIHFSAEAAFGRTGQFIARVTGPDSRFGVALDFLGHKSGKRGEHTAVTIVDAGLYKCRSVDKKGNKDDIYYVIWQLDDVLIQTTISEASALKLSKDLALANIEALGRSEEISDTEMEILASSHAKDPNELVDVRALTAMELGIEPGKMPRKDLNAARQQYVQRMRGPQGGREALEARRGAVLSQIEQLQRELTEIETSLGTK